MSKQDDISDLLGEGTAKPAKKTTAKKTEAAAPVKKASKKVEPVAEAKPVKKTAAAAPAKKVAEAKAEKPASVKAPVRFAEGERNALYDAIAQHFKRSKKSINSKELATKLGVETRKLRPVLYALANRAEPVVTLELSASKVHGMTVSPA